MIRLIVLATFIMLNSCSRKTIPIESINVTNYSTYQVRATSSVIVSNERDGIRKAYKKIFEKLFFIGSPGTLNSEPLILSQNKNNLNEFFDSFMSDAKYNPFINEIGFNSQHVQNRNNNYWIFSCDVVVDIISLRKYLEREGVIRKFGI